MKKKLATSDMIAAEHREYVKTSARLANEIYDKSNEHLITDATTDAQASVRFENDATYLTIRGSESRTDWFYNIMFRFRFVHILATGGGVRGHSGFVWQWQSVRDEVVRLLEARHNPQNPVVCCGHSLGGAVATIAALDLCKSLSYRTILVSFGSPRALNWRAKEAFLQAGIPAYRVTNGSDVVAMVPIVWLHHVGKHIECNAKPWWYLISVMDHSMSTYAKWGCDLGAP